MTKSAPAFLLLTTGGTIDKVYFDALSTYQVGTSQIGGILNEARITSPDRVVELMRKDSLELDDDDRERIVDAVGSADESRVIITHDTDTMTMTAQALRCISAKTIVLVGALAPACFKEGDSAFNLGMAFATVQVAPPGVYIAMNGTIFEGASVIKDRRLGVFVSQ